MTDFVLPDNLLDADIAILGRKGGGKTYTSKGIVERLLDMGRRVLILDPLGVWAGLRTSADGKEPGYPVAIFGGEHGDMPLV
jgi:DNA helicase HerA-like ATPase